ncbi:MAG: hypothetical protein GEU86_05280 [Actinophytocola sp.]|nr:hypothetical protein [Actinophytocola sp.]
MARKALRDDIDEAKLATGQPKDWAAGIPGVAVSVKRAFEQAGPVRATRYVESKASTTKGTPWAESSCASR